MGEIPLHELPGLVSCHCGRIVCCYLRGQTGLIQLRMGIQLTVFLRQLIPKYLIMERRDRQDH